MTKAFYQATLTEQDTKTKVLNWLSTRPFHVDSDTIKITGIHYYELEFYRYRCEYDVTWQGEVGTLDEGTYNVLYNRYERDLDDYIRYGNKMSPAPYKPEKSHYVNWQHTFKTLNGSWKSHYRLMSNLKLTHWSKYVGNSEQVLNLFKRDSNTVVFNDSRVYNDICGVKESLPMYGKDEFIAACSQGLDYSAGKQVDKDLPPYNRNVTYNTALVNSHIDHVLLPVYIVSYSSGDKTGACVIDAVNGNAISGDSLTSVGAGLTRLWTKIKGLFQKSPVVAEQTSYVSTDVTSSVKTRLTTAIRVGSFITILIVILNSFN